MLGWCSFFHSKLWNLKEECLPLLLSNTPESSNCIKNVLICDGLTFFFFFGCVVGDRSPPPSCDRCWESACWAAVRGERLRTAGGCWRAVPAHESGCTSRWPPVIRAVARRAQPRRPHCSSLLASTDQHRSRHGATEGQVRRAARQGG